MSDNKETKQAWAPDRIWLQRSVGDDGSHTWCSDSQDEHEQAEYVRVDVQAPAVEAGARDERPVDPDDIDAVSEAIQRECGCEWEVAQRCAVAAIDTLIARGNHSAALSRASEVGQVSKGWKLVPAEPTVEMLNAALPHDVTFGHGFKRRIYQEMIAAAPQPANEPVDEGCTPADARMLRAANHGLADENAMLRRRLRPFAALANPRLSWAMVEYCIDGDPEKQTLQAPQMQRAFNRAAEALADELPSHEPADCDALDLPDWIKNAKPPVPEQPANEQQGTCSECNGSGDDFGGFACEACGGTGKAESGLSDDQRRVLIRVYECLYVVAGYKVLSSELANAFSAVLAAKGDGHAD